MVSSPGPETDPFDRSKGSGQRDISGAAFPSDRNAARPRCVVAEVERASAAAEGDFHPSGEIP